MVTAYSDVGVDYSALDPAKLHALQLAQSTSKQLIDKGFNVFEETRGEPAFVVGAPGFQLAFVLECLGTKSVIAQMVLDELNLNRFYEIGYDSVAAIANDLICVGALPTVINAYFATGASNWYENRDRHSALVEGWADACKEAGAAWGGGESPSLSGLVDEKHIEIAGACVGVFPPNTKPLTGNNIQEDDGIILVPSNGLHANGASLARKVVESLELRFETPLSNGETLGKAILSKSYLYVRALVALYELDVRPSYISHITGHGFLKIMRSSKPLTYIIEKLPPVPPVLSFLVEKLSFDPLEAYTTFNMGAGLAIFVSHVDVDRAIDALHDKGFAAIKAGYVARGEREVRIEQLGLKLTSEMYNSPTAIRSAE